MNEDCISKQVEATLNKVNYPKTFDIAWGAELKMRNQHQHTSSCKNTIEVVYDGECPACSYLFERILKLRAGGWDIVLTDARNHPDVAHKLQKNYSIDINRDFGACIEGKWHFGSNALYALFFADFAKSVLARKFLLAILRVSYPVLRVGRALLLSTLGRRKISY